MHRSPVEAHGSGVGVGVGDLDLSTGAGDGGGEGRPGAGGEIGAEFDPVEAASDRGETEPGVGMRVVRRVNSEPQRAVGVQRGGAEEVFFQVRPTVAVGVGFPLGGAFGTPRTGLLRPAAAMPGMVNNQM